MTLVVAVNGAETIWLLADRRLSINDQSVKEDARKMMILITEDGAALLGYSGLGATLSGNEPADWMGRVLQTRSLSLEDSLRALSMAIDSEIPFRLKQMAATDPTHTVVVNAFLGDELRTYTIDVALSPDKRQHSFRFKRRIVASPEGSSARTPLCLYGGSGSASLDRDRLWQRPLSRYVRACDRKKVSPHFVANYLATVNFKVHSEVPSVGPRCIVAWLNKTVGADNDGGGIQWYDGVKPEAAGAHDKVPTMFMGIDFNEAAKLLGPLVKETLLARLAGDESVTLDVAKIEARLSRLPGKPNPYLL